MPAAEVQTQGGEVQGLCLEIGTSTQRGPIILAYIRTDLTRSAGLSLSQQALNDRGL